MSLHQYCDSVTVRRWLENARINEKSARACAENARRETERYVELSRLGEPNTGALRTSIRNNLVYCDDYFNEARNLRERVRQHIRANLHNITPDLHRKYRFEAPVAYYGLHIGYSMHHDYKEMGKRFGQCLRDEDGDECASMLDDLNRSGISEKRRVARNLASIWSDKVGDLGHCEKCGAYHATDDDYSFVHNSDGQSARWCSDCVDSDAYYSEKMDEWIKEDDKIAFFDDIDDFDNDTPIDYVTYDYGYRRRGYHYMSHPRSGDSVFVTTHVYEHWQEEYEEPRLPGYHTADRVGFIATEYEQRAYPVYCGVEVELEFGDGNERERNRCIKELRNAGIEDSYMVMEYDGSLNVGVECVTGYTGLDVHRQRMPDLLRIAQDNDACDLHYRTGVHVHVSREHMTPWHMAKLAAFVYDPDNRDFIEKIAGREFGDYREDIDHHVQINVMGQRARACRLHYRQEWSPERRMQYVKAGMGYDQSRYAALSFNPSTGDKTVEFRMFQGTTESDVVLAYVDFAFLAWHFSMQHSMKEMNEAAFVKFVYRSDNRTDSKFLRKYMENNLHIPQARSIAATIFKAKKVTA